MAILKFLGILLEVVLLFNLLIVVHELGHFLAAKWRGLIIEGFGIWFGKPIWKKKVGGITYSLGSIPAGGFVKLPQLMDSAIEGDSDYAGKELPRLKPVDKIIVAFAGPLFSFGLACVFAIIVWQVGRPVSESEHTTIIGAVGPGSPAEAAGMKPGDQILSIDGQKVTRWGGQSKESVTWCIAGSEEPKIHFQVLRDGKTLDLEATPKIEETKWYQRKGLRQVLIAPMNHPMVAKTIPGSPAAKAGFLPDDVLVGIGGHPILDDSTISLWAKSHPGEPMTITVERGDKKPDGSYPTTDLTFNPRGFIVDGVLPDSPASRGGLEDGDRIVAIDGKPVTYTEGFVEYIWAHQDQPVKISVERPLVKPPKKLTGIQKFFSYFRMKDEPLKAADEAVKKEELTVTPKMPIEGGTKPSIGIHMDRGDGLIFDEHGRLATSHPGPLVQVSEATNTIFETFKKLSPLSKSSIGIQQLGGPLMIGRVYYMLFESPHGWQLVLWFSVVINVNLALMNMLPIPPLDGSHITLAVIELIRRRPPGLRTQWVVERIQIAGTMAVIGFMFYVTMFDAQDIFGGRSQTMRFKMDPDSGSAAKPTPAATK